MNLNRLHDMACDAETKIVMLAPLEYTSALAEIEALGGINGVVAVWEPFADLGIQHFLLYGAIFVCRATNT